MDATVSSIFDLEMEWRNAGNGFSSGVNFKTWLADNVIQLRAQAAELQAAHVYLDESYINDPDAPPLPLADRIAPLVSAYERVTALEAVVNEAHEIIGELSLSDDADINIRAITWLRAHAPQASVTEAQHVE